MAILSHNKKYTLTIDTHSKNINLQSRLSLDFSLLNRRANPHSSGFKKLTQVKREGISFAVRTKLA